jgi:hypothetical protein
VTGAGAGALEALGAACGPVPAELLALGEGAAILVEGLRHKYSGTAINIVTHTSATMT